MGKISNAIQMLNYLNTGNKYRVKELAEKIASQKYVGENIIMIIAII